jgi:hypothetical protein
MDSMGAGGLFSCDDNDCAPTAADFLAGNGLGLHPAGVFRGLSPAAGGTGRRHRRTTEQTLESLSHPPPAGGASYSWLTAGDAGLAAVGDMRKVQYCAPTPGDAAVMEMQRSQPTADRESNPAAAGDQEASAATAATAVSSQRAVRPGSALTPRSRKRPAAGGGRATKRRAGASCKERQYATTFRSNRLHVCMDMLPGLLAEHIDNDLGRPGYFAEVLSVIRDRIGDDVRVMIDEAADFSGDTDRMAEMKNCRQRCETVCDSVGLGYTGDNPEHAPPSTATQREERLKAQKEAKPSGTKRGAARKRAPRAQQKAR